MAQYNNPIRRNRYYDQRQQDGLIQAMNNRVFVPEAPILPAVPGGVAAPAAPGQVNNPFFKGDGPDEYELPQGVQYYGDGGSQTSVPMEEFVLQAEAQMQADEARARTNEGIMTGDINPKNPFAAAVLQAQGVEITAGMLGQKALEPDEVIKNIYGPRVANGSLPTAEDDLVIQARRKREAEARAKVESFIAKNRESLTVHDEAGFWQQHYQTFPEFGEGRQPPKTRDEVFADQRRAEEEQFKTETREVAAALGLKSLPFKRDKDGGISTDVGTLQMIAASINAQRDIRAGAGREIMASVQRQEKAIIAALGTAPKNLRTPEGRAWLVKKNAADQKIAALYTDADKRMTQTKAIPDNSIPRNEPVPGESGVPGDPAQNENGRLSFNTPAELDAGLKAGTVVPGVPFMYKGVLIQVDENNKPSKVNR
jgi:hypothetical protein